MRTLAALLLVAVALVATGCTADVAGGPVAERKVRVTTTTNFITDTLKEIGGDRVEVTGLMGPGVDPHLYKASAGDVRSLRQADLTVYGGLELEGKMADVLEKLAERQPTVAITSGIPRRLLLEPPQAGEQYDPHVWFDVALWKRAADTAGAALKRVDPGSAAYYDRNLRRLQSELDAADRYVRQRIATIPPQHRVLVTSHDAFAYFGRRYGMRVAAIQGISTASEATTADVQRVARLLAERRVPTAFIESSVPRQTVEAMLAAARELGHDARIGEELFTDAAGDTGTKEGTYVGMIRANADRIARGLGSSVRELPAAGAVER